MENRNGNDNVEIEPVILAAHDSLSRLSRFLKHKDDQIKRIACQKLRKQCRDVEQLCEDKINGPVDEIFGYLRKYIWAAESQIMAVHVIKNDEDVVTWKHFPMKTFYRSIIRALERGVPRVVRIFILYKNETTGLSQGYLDHRVRELMQKQKKDGIHVKVILEDEIDDRSYIQNWIVIDDKVVEHSSSASDFGGPYWANRKTSMTADSYEVEQYTEAFLDLEESARELDDWLVELDLLRTTELPVAAYVQ